MPNVLVADDDDLLCELVRFKLEGAGHQVEVVSDGAAVLASLDRALPDVVVLDSMMPVMSGPEVLHAIKSRKDTSALPVIMLTARKGQDDVVSALRAGAADYLTKPFMPDELTVRVASVLSSASRDAGHGDQH